jgi:hypothetical protein
VAVSHAEQLGRVHSAAEAGFSLTQFQLSACPLRLGGDVVIFRPCALISGGTLHSSSAERASFRPYVAWGALGELSVRLGEVAEIVGDAGVGVPLIRDTFTFGCDTTARNCSYSQTTQSLYISTGLGFRLLLP